MHNPYAVALPLVELTMRVAALAAILLLLAPAAAAHIELTVTAPAAPIPALTPTAIQVAAAAECTDTFLGVPPSASASTDLVLKPNPSNITGAGTKLEFTAAECVPTGSAPDTGTVTLTPGPRVQAFTNLSLEIGTANGAGEGGAFKLQVAYYAGLTASVPADIVAGTPFTVVLNVSSNFDSNLTLSARGGGHVNLTILPSTIQVDSPLLENKTFRLVPVALLASGTANGWTAETIKLTVTATPRGHAGNGTTATIDLPVKNGTTTSSASNTPGVPTATRSGTASTSTSRTTTGSQSTTSTGSKDSPAASPFVALAVVATALAIARRRLK